MDHDRRNVTFAAGKGFAGVGFNAAGSGPHAVQNQTGPFLGQTANIQGSVERAKVKASPFERYQDKIRRFGRYISGISGLAWCVNQNKVCAVTPQVG